MNNLYQFYPQVTTAVLQFCNVNFSLKTGPEVDSWWWWPLMATIQCAGKTFSEQKYFTNFILGLPLDHSNTDKSLQPGRKVSLKPLKAQVGGHVYMKLLNDNYVCKPLNDREVKFYQNTPKNLLQHVPKYLGTVQIQQQQQLEEDTNYR